MLGMEEEGEGAGGLLLEVRTAVYVSYSMSARPAFLSRTPKPMAAVLGAFLLLIWTAFWPACMLQRRTGVKWIGKISRPRFDCKAALLLLFCGPSLCMTLT